MRRDLDALNCGHTGGRSGGDSARNRLGNVLQLGDVQNGAARDVFGEAVSVQVNADLHCVFGDPRHVVMGDVTLRAV